MKRVAVVVFVTACGLATPPMARGQAHFDPDSPFIGFPKRYSVVRCERNGRDLAGTVLQSGSTLSLRPHDSTQAGLFSEDRPSREPELAFVDTRGEEQRFESRYHRYPFGVRESMKEEIDVRSGLDLQGGFLETARIQEKTAYRFLDGFGWTTGEFGRTTRTKRFFYGEDGGTRVVIYEARETGYTRAGPEGGTKEVEERLTCVLRPLD